MRQIRACGDVRTHALEALAETVMRLQIHRTSEREAVTYLARELAARGVSSHWYPAGEEAGSDQSGCIVAFDTAGAITRTAFTNGRLQAASGDVLWEGFGYFYLSPQVLTPDGLVGWGDIGCTVYTGSDPAVQTAVRTVWGRNQAVLESLAAAPAPTTLDVFALNTEESAKRGLTNIAWSLSGNGYNIGHDFPRAHATSLEDPHVHALPRRRRYIDGITNRLLAEALWTYEARDRSEGYPLGAVQFHEILTMVDGEIIRLPSYERILPQIGMGWVMT